MFVSKIIDGAGEADETEVCLDIARHADCISIEEHEEMMDGYGEVNRVFAAKNIKTRGNNEEIYKGFVSIIEGYGNESTCAYKCSAFHL